MRLKKIKLFGFKSFGDTTSVDFIDGITAIVGPNGCGKSNIADAFRWVLGEQSVKSLRGHRMPDVIFSGTSSRKALNFAEVSLTLSEVQGALPIEYDEVTVTRRLHRSGESEYFLNKHPVRLRDIQSLFLDTGIGRSAFSIFEQGKIDQVIQQSPEERRVLFEEAAGILRFLQRKSEALRKLEQTEQNLQRVQDLYVEVERQIIVLQRQAEDAHVYKQKKEEYDTLDRVVLQYRFRQLLEKLVRLRTNEKQGEEQVALALQRLEVRQKDRIVLDEALVQATQRLQTHREQTLRAEGALGLSNNARKTAQDRLREVDANEKRWAREIDELVQRFDSWKGEKELAERRLAELDELRSKQAATVEKQRQTMTSGENLLTGLRSEQGRVQQQRVRCVEEESRVHSLLVQTKTRLEHGRNRLKALESRRDQHLRQISDLDKSFKEKGLLAEQLTGGVEAGKSTLSATDAQLQQIADAIRATQRSVENGIRSVAEHKARESTLLRLREDWEGFSKGSKRLLQESANPKSPLHGKLKPLYTDIIPKPGYEMAVSALLNPYAQALVVETQEDLQQVLTFTQQQALTDFSLICRSLLGSKQDQIPDNYASLLSAVELTPLAHHFAAGTLVVEKCTDLLSVAQQGLQRLICSRDGYTLDAYQVFVNSAKGGSDPFLREAELRSLSAKLADAEQQLQSSEMALQRLRQERDRLQKERHVQDSDLRRSEMQLVEANFSVRRAEVDLERLRQDAEKLLQEQATTQRELEELAKTLVEAEAQFADKQTESAASGRRLAEVESELKQCAGVLDADRLQLRQCEIALGSILDEQRKLGHSINLLLVKEQEGEGQRQRLELELRAGRELRRRLEQEEQDSGRRIKELEEQLTACQAGRGQLEQQVEARRGEIAHFEVELERERNQLRRRERELAHLRVQLAEAHGQQEAIGNELEARYGSREALDNAALPMSLSEAEIRLRELRAFLETHQSVNLTSIEEHEKQQERYRFLSTQIGDLQAAKQELRQIISQLDDESRQLFQATFETIRQNFRKNFQILFEGGEADLVLAEGLDLLEAGIEIQAKPPGKQMRSIHLLSGGEKCLTALALLFALFEVKPAPFCVLDEIDAPLDDSNVHRFVKVVKHFSDRCQFILITHNKTSMSIADVLVGVSMQERGVSKIVSMSFAREGQQLQIALAP